MTYKSDTQPLCRTCGKRIAKSTTTIWVRRDPYVDHYISERPDFGRMAERGAKIQERVELPRQANTLYGTILRSKEDCQAKTNGRVVSVQYHEDYTVARFNVWDGESYDDEFFCTGSCARRFAYFALNTGTVPQTKAYFEARKQSAIDIARRAARDFAKLRGVS